MTQLFELGTCKRSTELFLRALWARGFAIGALTVNNTHTGPLSYLEHDIIFLPDKVTLKRSYANYYLAASTHTALHALSDAGPFDPHGLNFMQRNVIGLVEDLKLELQAIKSFPGLRHLWLAFHDDTGSKRISAMQLMLRLSRSVLDPHYQDEHQWVTKGRREILNKVCDCDDPGIVVQVGLALANDLGQMRLPLNSGQYEQPVAYRDDNRCLWKKTAEQRHKADTPAKQGQAHFQNSKFVESNSNLEILLSTTLPRQGEGFSIVEDVGDDLEFHQLKSQEMILSRTYPEWDYRTQIEKQDWCCILEHTARPGSLAVINEISSRHKFTLDRLRRLASRLRIEKQLWMRKVEEGEEVDLDYMVENMVELRASRIPDNCIFMRRKHLQEKNLAISILLDLSESTNDLVKGGMQSINQILRDAILLLSETLDIVGDTFAIAGFSSNGRQQINFTRFKSYDESFGSIKDRLSGMTGAYSTRLGAAIRHCASDLRLRPERKKLLLIITDGAPSDIDVYDEHYLVQDSWFAVRNLYSYGIKPFCINLDRRADKIIQHIFGKARSETLDSVARLPDLLAHLYMRYMRG